MENLKTSDVSWIVNKEGDLGVMIGKQRFYLYKGESLEYSEDEEPDYRPVEKREFGESCHPLELPRKGPFGSVTDKDLEEYNKQFEWIKPGM